MYGSRIGTPSDEVANPVKYFQEAEQLANANGYQLICTIQPGSQTAEIAPYCSLVDIQAQDAQGTAGNTSAEIAADVTKYSHDIEQYIPDVKQANPNAIVLSGIADNPAAGYPTSEQLAAITQYVYDNDKIQGWWLNMAPVESSNRQPPEPQIATGFLDLIGPGN